MEVGMAIQARPAGTPLDPTLMGRVLPGPIKNRVGYGFKTKTQTWSGLGPGFDETQPELDPVTYKITYLPIYI